jgi:hypothetical protein
MFDTFKGSDLRKGQATAAKPAASVQPILGLKRTPSKLRTAAAADDAAAAATAAATADPGALPPGWSETADAEGDMYWYNDAGVTSWTRPT